MAAFNLNRSPVKPRLPASLEAQGYEAVKQIGKGSFGLAYLVENTVTRKQFVAKLINTAQMSAAEKKEAHNEIKMLQQMEHPYIVRYVDYQEDRSHLYIIMEYADGGDLASHIAKVKATGRPMPEREAMRLFTQTALALKHMHDRRMLHRDIKAQNVFMTKSLDVKMGDFGISTVLKNTMAMAQTVCGTPYYFSPELCAGRPYNNKSDIWALGVLLYNICSGGDMPFDATSMKGLMEAIMKRAPRRLSGPYGAEVNDLISSMLQKDSKKRPNIDGVLSSTAVQMHCAELIAGVSLTSGTDSPPASGRSPSRSPEVRRHSQLPPIPRPPQQQQAGQYLTPQPSPKHTPNPSPKHSPMPSPHVTPQRSPARSPARVPPMRAGGAALDNGMAASPHAVDNYYYHPAAGAAGGGGAGALPRYRPLPRVVDVRAVAAVAGGGGGGAGGNNGGARASPVRAPWV